VIHPTAIIGADPFSFYPDNGRHREGARGTDVHEDVNILPFVIVESGTARPTSIAEGTRIAPFVYIGHDAAIGRRVWIAARAAVAGWVEVDDGAYLGMGCTVIQGVKIGRNALVGMGAVVLCDVPENAIVVGNPARFLRMRTTEGRA